MIAVCAETCAPDWLMSRVSTWLIPVRGRCKMSGLLGARPPALYMMVTVACFSVFPVLFKIGGAGESPFLFAGILQLSAGIGMCTVMLFGRKRLQIGPTAFEGIMSQCKTWYMLFAVIASFHFVLFAHGLSFVDVSIAAILYETWPVFLMLIMSFIFYDKEKGKDKQRYDPISIATWFFVVLALVGVGLVILSHNDTARTLHDIWSDLTHFRTMIGVGLVLLAAFLAAARPAFTSKMGEYLAKKHSSTEKGEMEEIAFATAMTCVCNVLTGGGLVITGLAVSENFSTHILLYAIMSGVLNSFAIVTFRTAILKTDNLGVSAIGYATPLITLIWLWALSILDVVHLDYLVIGAMGIAVSNLLIIVKASKRVAYKALVASLWVFGTFVYFHEGYATDIPLELPVTVFILVLAFRVDRLVRRTGQEEEWVLEAFHKIELLVSGKKHVSAPSRRLLSEALRTLICIDKHETTGDLNAEYRKMVKQLRDARTARSTEDEITEIRRLVDNLVHSRQQGARLGEFVAITLTGGLIVLGLLIFNGNREIYGEITSFLLSSVVVFLLFNIVDLQRDRKDETLIKESGEYIVNFSNTKNRETQQYISMGTSCVIVAVFVWLFFIGA